MRFRRRGVGPVSPTVISPPRCARVRVCNLPSRQEPGRGWLERLLNLHSARYSEWGPHPSCLLRAHVGGVPWQSPPRCPASCPVSPSPIPRQEEAVTGAAGKPCACRCLPGSTWGRVARSPWGQATSPEIFWSSSGARCGARPPRSPPRSWSRGRGPNAPRPRRPRSGAGRPGTPACPTT